MRWTRLFWSIHNVWITYIYTKMNVTSGFVQLNTTISVIWCVGFTVKLWNIRDYFTHISEYENCCRYSIWRQNSRLALLHIHFWWSIWSSVLKVIQNFNRTIGCLYLKSLKIQTSRCPRNFKYELDCILCFIFYCRANGKSNIPIPRSAKDEGWLSAWRCSYQRELPVALTSNGCCGWS